VLAAGDLPGFTPQTQESQVSESATQAAATMTEGPGPEREQAAARLRRLGFIAAVHERLAPTSGSDEAVSIVQQFPSASAATQELAAETKNPAPKAHVTRFAVPGIPGARGFAASGGEFSGINVAFAVGSYYYLVGAGWKTGVPEPPTRDALIGAARHLYQRARR
jgi:hypothetical protein